MRRIFSFILSATATLSLLPGQQLQQGAKEAQRQKSLAGDVQISDGEGQDGMTVMRFQLGDLAAGATVEVSAGSSQAISLRVVSFGPNNQPLGEFATHIQPGNSLAVDEAVAHWSQAETVVVKSVRSARFQLVTSEGRTSLDLPSEAAVFDVRVREKAEVATIASGKRGRTLQSRVALTWAEKAAKSATPVSKDR